MAPAGALTTTTPSASGSTHKHGSQPQLVPLSQTSVGLGPPTLHEAAQSLTPQSTEAPWHTWVPDWQTMSQVPAPQVTERF